MSRRDCAGDDAAVVVMMMMMCYWFLVPYRPEGCEDLLQHLQESLLPAGGDVVLGQL